MDDVNPDIMTLAEYDERWASLGLAPEGAGEKYKTLTAEGMTAAIVYDSTKFTPLPLPAGEERLPTLSPKCSCCALLSPLAAPDLEIYVVAVHFESGDPSNGNAVLRRAEAVENVRERVEEVAGRW